MRCCTAPRRRDHGATDTRTANLLGALSKRRRILPARIVYVSTSGVYGDCGGALVDESRPLGAAHRSAHSGACDAERQLAALVRGARGRRWSSCARPASTRPTGCRSSGCAPATPVLRREDDVYTNHIHADDLAAIVCRALETDAPAGRLQRSRRHRDEDGRLVRSRRRHAGLPRPAARRARARARRGFRQLAILHERVAAPRQPAPEARAGRQLRYPTVHEGLAHEHAAGVD